MLSAPDTQQEFSQHTGVDSGSQPMLGMVEVGSQVSWCTFLKQPHTKALHTTNEGGQNPVMCLVLRIPTTEAALCSLVLLA